jgi:ParB family chromosome partitioning protein
MRMPWDKSKAEQLDLLDEANAEPFESLIPDLVKEGVDPPTSAPTSELSLDALNTEGLPLLVPVDCLQEDPANPRTEFPNEEIAELADDIAQRGILQPIVVRPLADGGRYRVLFGAKRLRAAKRAGLKSVPVVIGSDAHDAYAQVAENQKRHGLTPLDLARFMRSRADAGESNGQIAKRMDIDLTSVAHHLALLSLPPELDEALRSGRCTSPRTLYELAKLQKTKPEQVKAIVTGKSEITRQAVASLAKPPRSPRATPRKMVASRRPNSLAGQAGDLCARLEMLFGRMAKPERRSLQKSWRPCVVAWQSSQPSRGRTVRPPRLAESPLSPNDRHGQKRRDERDECRKGRWPRSVLSSLRPRGFVMSSTSREYFTVDLRGLRAALAARAARDGITESDVLRSALSVTLREGDPSPLRSVELLDLSPAIRQIKLSVRVSPLAARRLDLNARDAGLSRGAYLMRLIDGAPPVIPSAERAAGFAALNASASELAIFSRDINHLTHLLRAGSLAAAREYRRLLDTLDGDVRKHLELSASVIAELMSDRKGRAWTKPASSIPTRSPP